MYEQLEKKKENKIGNKSRVIANSVAQKKSTGKQGFEFMNNLSSLVVQTKLQDDAKINSRKFKVSFYEEIARLVIHGVLHLLDYDDQTKSDKKVMKRMENKLLYNFKFILL